MTDRRMRPIATVLAAVLGLTASGILYAHPGGGSFHGAGHAGGYGHGGWARGGWRGGYYGGWGLFGAGLFQATLPWYYSTYYWDGVPYYYADTTYYRWNGRARQYEIVTSPAARTGSAAPQLAASTDLFMYPKGGQSTEQQARDRYECHRWAADQTGFDPTQTGGGVTAEAAAAKRANYLRADGACLEGRNYSVR